MIFKTTNEINSSKLKEDLLSAGIMVEGIITKELGDETQITLVPDEGFSLDEEHIISELIESHVAENYIIYRYVERESNQYYTINYNLLGFKKERIFIKGELVVINYWSEYDKESNTYSGLAVKEDVEYIRDSNGYISHRIKKITRYTEKGNQSEPKVTYKYYSPEEATIAGEKRRSNVINKMKVDTVGLIAQTEQIPIKEAEQLGLLFLDEYTLDIQRYRDGDREQLINSLSSDTSHQRLDNDIGGITVRQYLLSQISY